MTRMHRTMLASLVITVVGISAVPEPADAQIRRLRDRAQAEAERRAEQRAEDAVVAAFDAIEGAIVCVATDTECLREAREQGKEVVVTDEHGNQLPRDQYPASALGPGEGPWLNYDFVPGERMIFAESFERDNVGDFPRRFEFMRGNMEIAEWRGGRWLRASTDARFAIELPEILPDRFTLEFDYTGGRGRHTIHFDEAERGRPAVRFYYYIAGIHGGGLQAEGQFEYDSRDQIHTVRVMADGSYVKVYANETRVANVPNADLGRSNRIVFSLLASANNPVFVSNFRIAAGGRELYDALAADGRVVARGVLFDTGSERLRPESTPVLREIGETLRDHPDLRLRIEGHTDSVGDADMNQALSERRAESVVRYLVEKFGIDAARLESVGFGETQPVDSNDTAEGRQNNRRVELVRI